MTLALPSLDEWRASVRERERRADYARDPVLWAREKLNRFLWSLQREICYSVRDHRYTAVPAGYGCGKSNVAAVIIAWWVDVHPPGTAKIITTATNFEQIKSVLWQEIADAHAAGQLPGRLNLTEWWIEVVNPDGTTSERLVAFGRKPAEHNQQGIAGVHARYPLAVIDEAGGVEKWLWDSMKGIMANSDARLLAIGNPMDSDTEFARVCKPGSGYNVIRIPVWNTPNFNGHSKRTIPDETIPEELTHYLVTPLWQQERLAEWGEDSPMYQSKVDAEFPEHNEHGLISARDIREAQQRWTDLAESGIDPWTAGTLEGPIELGVDVGGGGDKNVIAARAGRVVRITREDQEPDTMKTLDHVLDDILATGATRAKVDYIGIGHGAVDRARQMATDQALERENPALRRRALCVEPVTVSEAASDPKQFVNLRAEIYWSVRELFRAGVPIIDPKDHKLASQLGSIRYEARNGRIQIESKQDMRARKMPSPDRADAFVLAWYAGKPKVANSLTFRKGRR